MEQRIRDLVKFIQETHAIHADGCKGSCNEQRVAFENTMYEEPNPRWICNFGGYCLGHLPRHCEVTASTFEELDAKVRQTITSALEQYQKEIDEELNGEENRS